MKKFGYSLVEIMVVITIISILAMLAFPTFNQLIGKAKRSEALVQLRSLYAAEKMFYAEYGRYTDKLSGKQSIAWSPDGYKQQPERESFAYTYGFSGGEKTNYVVGNLKTAPTLLQGTYADQATFKAYAVGAIKGQAKPDIISIDETGTIVIVQDALQ